MILRPGVHQFVYDSKNGDIRIFDVFRDGRIKETIAKNSESTFVEPNYALRRLDEMIDLADREAEAYKKIPFYCKTSRTKVNILSDIREFIIESSEE
jgi:hypothetical protein